MKWMNGNKTYHLGYCQNLFDKTLLKQCESSQPAQGYNLIFTIFFYWSIFKIFPILYKKANFKSWVILWEFLGNEIGKT